MDRPPPNDGSRMGRGGIGRGLPDTSRPPPTSPGGQFTMVDLDSIRQNKEKKWKKGRKPQQRDQNDHGENRDDPRPRGFLQQRAETGHHQRRMECYNCHKDGHMSKDCPEKWDNHGENRDDPRPRGFLQQRAEIGHHQRPMECYNCHKDGHMSKDCPEKWDNHGENRNDPRTQGFLQQRAEIGHHQKPMECYNCHISKDCPEKGDSEWKRPQTHRKSNEEGHVERESPKVMEAATVEAATQPLMFTCYKEEGHVVQECPRTQCHQCNEYGHKKWDCKKKPGFSNDVRNMNHHGDRFNSVVRNVASVEFYHCHEPGHLLPDCPKFRGRSNDAPNMAPGVGAGFGQRSNDVRNMDRSGDRFNRDERNMALVECHYCHKPGHSIAECRRKQYNDARNVAAGVSAGFGQHSNDVRHMAPIEGPGFGQGSVIDYLAPLNNQRKPFTCHNCKEEGHKARYCPKGNQEGRPDYNMEFQRSETEQHQTPINFGWTNTAESNAQSASNSVAFQSQPASDFGSRESPQQTKFIPTVKRILDSQGEIDRVDQSARDAASPTALINQANSVAKEQPGSVQPGEQALGLPAWTTDTREEDVQEIDEVLPAATAEPQGVEQKVAMIEQLFKKDELLRLIKKSRFMDGECKCPPLKPCVCKKKILVVVNPTNNFHSITSRLAIHGIRAVAIYEGMDKVEQQRNVSRVLLGICNVSIVISSEAEFWKSKIPKPHWLIVLDIPGSIDQYRNVIEIANGENTQLERATIFYDPWVDHPLAGGLVKVLEEARQSVPEWLRDELSGFNMDSAEETGKED